MWSWAGLFLSMERRPGPCNVPGTKMFLFVYAECAAAADTARRCWSMREALPEIVVSFLHPTKAAVRASACRGCAARLSVGGC